MIVNADKVHVIIFDKHKRNYSIKIINIDQKEIKAVSKVKLSGI